MINKNDLRKAISSIAISNAKRNTIYKAFSDVGSITKEEFDSVKSDISKVVESMLTKDTVGKANGVASLDSNGSVPIEQLGNINMNSDITITDITKNDGYFYNLIKKANVKNSYYFTSEVTIPEGAFSLKMRFELSSGGGIGVEFRNASGNATGSYSNKTEPRGTKIEVHIPYDSKSIIFSYLNNNGLSIEGATDVPFDGITFYISSSSGSLISKVNALENAIQNIGSGDNNLYLSKDTDNVLQDNLTLDDLYSEYDNLCALYPQYIKRLDNLGRDAANNEIRQYQIGLNNQFYQIGEDKTPDKGADNLWNTQQLYNKILVNTGTHGDEKAPCYATMLAIKDLIESNDAWAMYIKSNACILLCPTLNPYGFQHRTLANANSVNINRDIIAQTQPESQAWKTWIDNNTDAIAYIDMHGVDYYTPFIEVASEDNDNIKLYSHITFRMASLFKSNWDKVFGKKSWSRPCLVKSTYSGMTIDYTHSKGIKGFIVETPCDVVNNQYNPAPNYFKSYSKSNKMTKDMLMQILRHFIENNN